MWDWIKGLFRRETCLICEKQISKNENTSTMQYECLDGKFEATICEECSKELEEDEGIHEAV